jgi:hypothetical protein
MIDVVTNTPRAGETPEQTAMRSAPRGMSSNPKPARIAKLAYLTEPGPGKFVLNLQFEGDIEASRVEISRAQLGNILVDGAAMAFRDQSTRLGPESFTPAIPDAETATIARPAADLGHEQNDAFVNCVSNDAFGKSDGL